MEPIRYLPPFQFFKDIILASLATAGARYLYALFKKSISEHSFNQHSARLVVGVVILAGYATSCLISAVRAVVDHLHLSNTERRYLFAILDNDVETLSTIQDRCLRPNILELAEHLKTLSNHNKEAIQEVSPNLEIESEKPQPPQPDLSISENFIQLERKKSLLKPEPTAYSEKDWQSAVRACITLLKDKNSITIEYNCVELYFVINFTDFYLHDQYLLIKKPTAETVAKAFSHIDKIRSNKLQPIYCPMSIRPDPLPDHYCETDDWTSLRVSWNSDFSSPFRGHYTIEMELNNIPQDSNWYYTLLQQFPLPYEDAYDLKIDPNQLRKVQFEPRPPLPLPDKNTRLSWLLNTWDQYQLPGINSSSRVNLERYVYELENEISPHLPKGHHAYAKMKIHALLSIEAMQKLPKEEIIKHLKEFALLGPLCGPGKKDATAELYEVITGDFSLELNTPGTVGEVFVKALEASIEGTISEFLTHIPQEIRHETGLITGYICSELKKRKFPVPSKIDYAFDLAIAKQYALQGARFYPFYAQKMTLDNYIIEVVMETVRNLFPSILQHMINEQLEKKPVLAGNVLDILKDYAVDLNKEVKDKYQSYIKAKNTYEQTILWYNSHYTIIKKYESLKYRLDKLNKIDLKKEDPHHGIIASLIAVTNSDITKLLSTALKDWPLIQAKMTASQKNMEQLENWYLNYEQIKSHVWTQFNEQYSLLLYTGEDYTHSFITLQGAIALAIQLGILTQTTGSFLLEQHGQMWQI